MRSIVLSRAVQTRSLGLAGTVLTVSILAAPSACPAAEVVLGPAEVVVKPAGEPLAPVVSEAVRQDVSAPLWLVPIPAIAAARFEMPRPGPLPSRRGIVAPQAAPAAGTGGAAQAGTASLAGPVASFEGIGNVDDRVPPDTVGDVGPHHVVEWVNLSLAVYDHAGNALYGPVPGNTLWSGFGGRCEAGSGGDPIVLYDALADRWLVSQLAFQWPHDFHQCVAVSQTGDPTGAWHRYDFFFDQDRLNDYPKFGVWPDAYYLAVNQFVAETGAWRGQGAIAFERGAMLDGLPARMVTFDLYGVDPAYGGALPADLDGPIPPSPGAPNVYVEVDDDAWGWESDRLSFWLFHVDWDTPEASTFGVGGQPNAVVDLTAAGHPFDSDMCGYASACIPQPGGSLVDALSDRLMNRLAYRNFGTHESLVVNHTVDVDGADRAGVRWYEIRDPLGTPIVHQAGTFSPDGDDRWMASAAMDGAEGLAIGFSVSGPTTYPSIRYAGRLAGDPPGILAQGEATLVAGSGYQTDASRWGDYSALTVDPTDDCTFWYLGEYVATSGTRAWRTRVGAFGLDGCGQCPLVGVPDLLVDRSPGGVTLTWLSAANASSHDVVSGSLGGLRSSAGDFESSTAACLANDMAGNVLASADGDPPVGDGFWYLVRGALHGCRGTLDDGGPRPAASRDDGVQAAADTCP